MTSEQREVIRKVLERALKDNLKSILHFTLKSERPGATPELKTWCQERVERHRKRADELEGALKAFNAAAIYEVRP